MQPRRRLRPLLMIVAVLSAAGAGGALAAPATQDRFVRIHPSPAPAEVDASSKSGDRFAARRDGSATRLMNLTSRVSLVVPEGFAPEAVSVRNTFVLTAKNGDLVAVRSETVPRAAFREQCATASGVLSSSDATDRCVTARNGGTSVAEWLSAGDEGLLLVGETRSKDAAHIATIVGAVLRSVHFEPSLAVTLPKGRKWTWENDKAGYPYLSDNDGAMVVIEDDITAPGASFEDAISEAVKERDLGSLTNVKLAEPNMFPGGGVVAISAQRAGLLVTGVLVRLEGPKPCWVLSLNEFRDTAAAGRVANDIVADILKRRAQ